MKQQPSSSQVPEPQLRPCSVDSQSSKDWGDFPCCPPLSREENYSAHLPHAPPMPTQMLSPNCSSLSHHDFKILLSTSLPPWRDEELLGPERGNLSAAPALGHGSVCRTQAGAGGRAVVAWTLAEVGRRYSPEMLLARDRLSQCWSWREAEMGLSPRRRRACGHRAAKDTVRLCHEQAGLQPPASALFPNIHASQTPTPHPQPPCPLVPTSSLPRRSGTAPFLERLGGRLVRTGALVPRTEVNFLPKG